MNIIEAMKERRSVRSYDGNGLTLAQIKDLERAISESFSPFSDILDLWLKQFNLKAGYKPSTYGMIKGAESFFLLGIGSDESSELTARFQFEQIVLKAWQLGLETCWIGATFKAPTLKKKKHGRMARNLRLYLR